MDHTVHNKLVSFIWSIADDCLRDVYVRGKYRDVILPMVVLRRLDALLEPTKDKVREEVNFQKNELKLVELDDPGLRDAAGYGFYNVSKWTLKSLKETATNNQQILLANMEEYLGGFSDNVKEIIRCFKLEAQMEHMAKKDVLLDVLEKFTSPNINLTPEEQEDPDGHRLPALTNLGMGYVFEELIRKFNEDNNEEAGEHFTPREVIELMVHLVFDPIRDSMASTLSIYDPACGSGGMLTEAQNFIKDPEKNIRPDADIHLYGREINDETYAICKSDMMIKNNDPGNIRPDSTLAKDVFSDVRFDFMLSNPPYGKSWASDQRHIKDGSDVTDARFRVSLPDYWGEVDVVDAVPRSSDGQLLFLMDMIHKMKTVATKDDGSQSQGSRIASVHNGSSLFTGDAGSGESNIRRHIIENDLLEAVIQLPNNLFYNTGITTYIWLLSNNKTGKRKGKVQLIDASGLYRKLRKNLGNKNCEFAPAHIRTITDHYLALTEALPETKADDSAIASKVFENRDFGYYKVNIERPDRRMAQFTPERVETLRFEKALREPMAWMHATWGNAVYSPETLKEKEPEILEWLRENEITLSPKNKKRLLSPAPWITTRKLLDAAHTLMEKIGQERFSDFNEFKRVIDKALGTCPFNLSPAEKKTITNAMSWYDESAEKVIRKRVKLSDDKRQELLDHLGCRSEQLADFGYYATGKVGEYLTYEPCTELRDSESVPLKARIHDYFLAEVKPHMAEAWINLDSTKIGYEISFNKYFYRHKPLRSMEAVAADIVALEQQAEGLIAEILGLEIAEVSGVEHA